MKRIINGQLTCRDCQQTKPVSEFNKRSQMKAGYDSRCRICANQHYAQWRDALDPAHLAKHRRDRCAAARRWGRRRRS